MKDQQKLLVAAAVVVFLVYRGRNTMGGTVEGARNWLTDSWAELSGLDAHQRRLLDDPLYAEIERKNIRAWQWPWEL